MIVRFENIFSDPDPSYQLVGSGAQMVSEGIEMVNGSGLPVKTTLFRLPDGTVRKWASLVDSFKRPEIVPREVDQANPEGLYDLPVNLRGPAGTLIVQKPGDPSKKVLVIESAEKRSIPRNGERKEADPATGDRRSGGALKSVFAEAKMFFSKPAGFVVLGVVAIVVVSRFFKR
jgi:hypothetical protein